MKEKLAKLIDVKSIMTLLLTLVFCVLALCGVVAADQFLTIFTVIVGFYFGTQSQKKAVVANPDPEQSESMPAVDSTQPVHTAVDEAVSNDTHPPDVSAKMGFEY